MRGNDQLAVQFKPKSAAGKVRSYRSSVGSLLAMKTFLHRSVQVLTCIVIIEVQLLAGIDAIAQVSWVGDVLIDGQPNQEWLRCSPCGPDPPPNTNWSNNRLPGFSGMLGDPGADAVIGPGAGVIELSGGTLADPITLNNLTAQSGLHVNGVLSITGSGQINALELLDGSTLNATGAVSLSGAGSWLGALTGAGGVSNNGTLTAATGNLRTTLTNNGSLSVSPSIDFGGAPGTLVNDLQLTLDSDSHVAGSNILDGSSSGMLINNATIAKFGMGLSVIESAGQHAGGTISARDGTLRFFRNDWLFSGGDMVVSNNGQIELTGNVNHQLSGTSGVTGQGSFLVNMNSFGTLTVDQPFDVNLTGPGLHGLLLQGIGVVVDGSTLTNRQGGQWSAGTIAGAFLGSVRNEAPFTDPFMIISGASKRITPSGRFANAGTAIQTATVRVDGVFDNLAGGDLDIQTTGNLTDWSGIGLFSNLGRVTVRGAGETAFDLRYDQRGSATLAQTVVEDQATMVLSGGGFWSGDTLTSIRSQTISETGLLFTGGTFQLQAGTHLLDGQESVSLSGSTTTIEVLANALLELRVISVGVISVADFEMLNGQMGGAGAIVNHGNFTWRGGDLGVGGQLQFTNAVDGNMLILSSAADLRGGTLTNAGLVEQLAIFNLFNADVVNVGTWTMFDNSTIAGSNGFTNQGKFNTILTVPGTATVAVPFSNEGTVRVGAGTGLRFQGPVAQLANGVLSGGVWLLGPDSTLIFPEPFTTIGPGTILRGLQRVDGIQAVAEILAAEASTTGSLMLDGMLRLSNGAVLLVDGQSSLGAPGGIQNGGPNDGGSLVEMLNEALVINRAPKDPDPELSVHRSGRAARLTALAANTPAITTPLLENWAILAPGGLALVGPFNLSGDLLLQPTSTLAIDIGGPLAVSQHDQLTVDGAATVDGRVAVEVVANFFPAVGQEFVIATASEGITGLFTGVDNVNREDIVWSVTETANVVVLTVTDVERIFADDFEG